MCSNRHIFYLGLIFAIFFCLVVSSCNRETLSEIKGNIEIITNVVDPDGNYLWQLRINDADNIQILLKKNEDIVKSTISSNGNYRFGSVEPSDYLVVAKITDNIFSSEQNVALVDDDIAIVDTLEFGPYSTVNIRICPNPFPKKVRIRYEVPDSICYVKVIVYNTSGDSVRLLVDCHQVVGHHTVMWDGRDSNSNSLPDGPYFLSVLIDSCYYTSVVVKSEEYWE